MNLPAQPQGPTGALPAHLLNRQSRNIIGGAMQGLGTTRGPHLSIKGNRFRVVESTGVEYMVPTLHFDVVIVDANEKMSKVFFEGAYDPSGNTDAPPTCWSDNGLGPSVQSNVPQSPTCAVCPNNMWGSDQSKLTGRGTKACTDRKKLAVIIPGDTRVMPYEFQVPPGSLKSLREYTNYLTQQRVGDRSLDVNDVITRLEFVDNAVGVLKFSAVGWADEFAVQMTEHLYVNKLTDTTVGRGDVSRDPAAFAQLAAPATAPAAVLPPPAAYAAAAPAAPAFLPPPAAPAAAQPVAPPAAPPRGRPRAPKGASGGVSAGAAAAAPFVAPAAPFTPQATQPAIPPAAPAAPLPGAQVSNGGLEIPPFLQRTAAPGPAAAPAAPQFGMQAAPPPPAGVQAALQAAMNLPKR